MLNAIIRLALRHRLLVVVASLAVLVYGGYVTTTLPIDVFPDLDRPRVVVMTEAPGMAPDEVETLVTYPLESALLGANGVQAVRSQSGPGLSVVHIEFDWGTDIHRARQTVQERISTEAKSLPEGVRPQMGPISSIMGQILMVGLQRRLGPRGGELAPLGNTRYVLEMSPCDSVEPLMPQVWDPVDRQRVDRWTSVASGSSAVRQVNGDREVTVEVAGRNETAVFLSQVRQQMAMRTMADWVVRPRLLKIAGVAQVAVMGGAQKQYQVLVNPDSMLTFGVTLLEIEEALRKNNLNASGGFALQGESERPVRVLGRLGPGPEKVVRDLNDMPVKTGPRRNVLLGQVARIVEGPQPQRGAAGVNGRDAVILVVTKQPHVDTRGLTEEVKAALKETEASLPADLTVNAELFQLKRFIDTGIYNVVEALVIGAVLVLIVLFLFLLNFRTTFISLSAIPLSLAITGIVFKAVGWITGESLSINVMTLGGIAVAMGELVDDAVVDVENIFRRLRENNFLDQPRPSARVIYEASVEVRGAIVFGTAMVIMVFLPLFALSGVEGRLFSPLGVAYIVSILASLAVSLTVTPVLSYYLLPRSRAVHREGDGPLLRVLKGGASLLVRLSTARAGTLLLLSWVMVGLAMLVLSRLGADFLPPFDEGSVQVNVTLPPGSSLEASNRHAELVDGYLRRMQRTESNPDGEVLQFSRRTGRAELDEHAEPVSNSEYILTLNPRGGRTREEVIRHLRDNLKVEAPGADIEVEQPMQHLISHMLSGVTAQIAIKVHGDDLNTLRRTAEEIKAAIEDVAGITAPVVEAQRQSDELHIRPRPERLAEYGLHRAEIAEFVRVALQGEEISQVLEGQRRFDLVVRLDEPYRADLTRLGRLVLNLPGRQGQVALGELCDIDDGSGPNVVNRENVRRRIVIRVNAQGRDLASVVSDVRSRVNQRVHLPEGYSVEYGGQFESQRRATVLIGLLAVLSFVGMFLVLFMLYPSWRIVLQILNALPISFIGGVAALAITQQTLTVAAMVGFISLGGIAARNGILLVSHYFHLMRHEGEGFTREMVMRGSLERLAPVLMTALTAGIALVPLVVVGHEPGREILYPVATVILGGLITSTCAEYLIHPGLFWRFSGADAMRLSHGDEEDDLNSGS